MFKLAAGSLAGSEGRLGTLTTLLGVAIETPSFVLYTKGGFVPSLPLPPDAFEPSVLLVPLADFVETTQCLETFAIAQTAKGKKDSSDLRSFCCAPQNAALMVVAEDPWIPFAEAKISKKRAVVKTGRGNFNVTPQQFMRFAAAAKVDIIGCPTNEPEFDGSVKVEMMI